MIGQPLCAGNLYFSFACQDDQLPLNGARITCDLSSGYLELFLSSGCSVDALGFLLAAGGLLAYIQLQTPLPNVDPQVNPVLSIAILSLTYMLLLTGYITRAVWVGKGCLRQGPV